MSFGISFLCHQRRTQSNQHTSTMLCQVVKCLLTTLLYCFCAYLHASTSLPFISTCSPSSSFSFLSIHSFILWFGLNNERWIRNLQIFYSRTIYGLWRSARGGGNLRTVCWTLGLSSLLLATVLITVTGN